VDRRSQPGSANPRAKLTEAQVLEARRRHIPMSRTDGATAIAREFGVSVNTMRQAILRERWRHI
jgi:hypothetical protein